MSSPYRLDAAGGPTPDDELADDELAALATAGPARPVRAITIDLDAGSNPPSVGRYLVTLGESTGAVGTVYRIEAVRRVVPRLPRVLARYALLVLPAPSLKAHAVADRGRVWVGGVEGLSLTWYPRTRKPASK